MEIEGLELANGAQLKPAIQLFVNEMQALPEEWESNAISAVHNSLQKIAPCE